LEKKKPNYPPSETNTNGKYFNEKKIYQSEREKREGGQRQGDIMGTKKGGGIFSKRTRLLQSTNIGKYKEAV